MKMTTSIFIGKICFFIILITILCHNIECNSFDDPYHIEGLPDGYDDWCKQNCRSFQECSNRYDDDFIDLRLKVNFSIDDGPGEHLISGMFMGDTISRQSFETQFIFDISRALDISPCRIYMLNIEPGDTHFSWESGSLLLSFRLFPADISKVRELTLQIQHSNSNFYKGKVRKEDCFLH